MASLPSMAFGLHGDWGSVVLSASCILAVPVGASSSARDSVLRLYSLSGRDSARISQGGFVILSLSLTVKLGQRQGRGGDGPLKPCPNSQFLAHLFGAVSSSSSVIQATVQPAL